MLTPTTWKPSAALSGFPRDLHHFFHRGQRHLTRPRQGFGLGGASPHPPDLAVPTGLRLPRHSRPLNRDWSAGLVSKGGAGPPPSVASLGGYKATSG